MSDRFNEMAENFPTDFDLRAAHDRGLFRSAIAAALREVDRAARAEQLGRIAQLESYLDAGQLKLDRATGLERTLRALVEAAEAHFTLAFSNDAIDKHWCDARDNLREALAAARRELK